MHTWSQSHHVTASSAFGSTSLQLKRLLFWYVCIYCSAQYNNRRLRDLSLINERPSQNTKTTLFSVVPSSTSSSLTVATTQSLLLQSLIVPQSSTQTSIWLHLQPQSCSGSNLQIRLQIRNCSYFSLHFGLSLTSQTIAAFSFTATLTQVQDLLSTDRLPINRDPQNQLSTASLLQPPPQCSRSTTLSYANFHHNL